MEPGRLASIKKGFASSFLTAFVFIDRWLPSVRQ
jgi:hypothetical protein